ncbi:MAG: prepilin peptidase [Verrucomicrobiota bacterium]|jgi:leader peptidase (prepilin peptidase)/N-methyltransferase
MTFADLRNFAHLHPGLAALSAGAFGACVGSFLNVCIHRLPKGESIVKPGSHCTCGQPIPFWLNIPLFGWLFLRGRAKCCGATISVRYPLVELATALLFVAAWSFLPPAKAVAACVFLPLLVLLAGCDLDDMMVPDAPNFALVGTGILFAMLIPSMLGETGHSIEAVNRFRALIDSLLGVAVGTALIWWIRTLGTILAGREAMGEADIILCAGIGAYCGWQGAVFCLFGGSVVGVVTALPSWIISKIKGEEYEGVVPFVPSLAVAGAVWFFRGPELVLAWRTWAGS